MASLKERLQVMMVEAVKAKDSLRLNALRMVIAAVKNKEIEKLTKALDDAEVLKVIGTMCKQRKESIEQFKKGGRDDLVKKETDELEYLMTFLPKQVSADEIKGKVKAVIAEVGANGPKDMGKVMKAVMEALTGAADGKLVSQIVKGELTPKG